MDTVYILIGRIGKENLSSQAQKKLKSLNELNDALIHLEKAYEEADEKAKPKFETKVEEARDYLENFEADFLSFLQDEEKDLLARQEKEAQKKEQLRLKKEKEAQEKQAKEKAEAEAKAKQEAEEKAAKEKAEAEAKAKQEAEEKAAKEKAEAEGKTDPTDPTDPKAKSSNWGLGFIIGGVLLTVATAGLYNHFKNK